MYVNGSALSVGDVVFGWKDPNGNKCPYHHPFLIIKATTTEVQMRNCTSHTSASFSTTKIAAGDKTGEHKWTCKDSHMVTDGPLETGLMSMPFYDYSQQVPVLMEGPPQFMQFANGDGTVSFKEMKPQWVEFYPLIVRPADPIMYDKIGTVKEPALSALLA
ncbi:hypothetical protein [Oceaniovalibus sp. ACAM 378]|uniref:hypothetical protein n=1 Tax=Oceaniovalibus sp. ACAM 378 TaxID=2599923 RepID=UPI0011DBE37F|nr:hypothetical protein [Oceaniovalibus sp. ACAM 378]TYB91112.1 hypothetical protein FQ320_00990 [Oceaniovalibus sp. ACAM 378]